MKKYFDFIAISLIVAIVGCTPVPTLTVSPTDSALNIPLTLVPTALRITEVPLTAAPTLSLEQFKNLAFFAPENQKNVQLTDGKFSEIQADGSTLMVNLDDHAAFGDINGDGIEDAALLLVESMGGTGSFVSIIALVSKEGGYLQTNSQAIDDRPFVHSISIVEGEITLNVNIHGPNDVMVDPTLNVTKTYRLYNGKMTLWRQTQLLADGKVRSIEIESPEVYSEVIGEVVLEGSMPIAPFENTLLLQLYGEYTMTNFVNSLMVDSADAGMPATFKTTIPLNMFKSGELVRVQLVEVSMADGSPMAIDTIVVKVK